MSTRTLIIGRARDSQVLLNHSSVSRRHAELRIDNDGVVEIRDLDSTGGTFVRRNGKEVPVRQATLRSGDKLRLGGFEITFEELLERTSGRPASVTGATSPATTPVEGERPKTRMVRCACGTIKERGAGCPSCGT